MKLLRSLAIAAFVLTAASAMSKPPVETPTGKWLAEDIRGGGVLDRVESVLELAPDGQVTGSGGCNRMSGRAEITGDRITFGPLLSTKMACAPAVMAQEDKFFAALNQAAAWRVDRAQHKLFLVDGAGQLLVTLAGM